MRTAAVVNLKGGVGKSTRVVVITNLSGSVYLKSQEDKNGRNLDLVKEVNGKEYFQGKQTI